MKNLHKLELQSLKRMLYIYNREELKEIIGECKKLSITKGIPQGVANVLKKAPKPTHAISKILLKPENIHLILETCRILEYYDGNNETETRLKLCFDIEILKIDIDMYVSWVSRNDWHEIGGKCDIKLKEKMHEEEREEDEEVYELEDASNIWKIICFCFDERMKIRGKESIFDHIYDAMIVSYYSIEGLRGNFREWFGRK